MRQNLIIAATKRDAQTVKEHFPQYRRYTVVTPRVLPPDVKIGEYVWTPYASELPARLRMELRGVLAPLIDEESVEEQFPITLLSW